MYTGTRLARAHAGLLQRAECLHTLDQVQAVNGRRGSKASTNVLIILPLVCGAVYQDFITLIMLRLATPALSAIGQFSRLDDPRLQSDGTLLVSQ